MAETPFNPAPATPKTFWKRPEGVTGTVFLLGLLAAGGYVLVKALPIFPIILGIMALAGAALARPWAAALGNALFLGWILVAVFPLA